MERESVVVVVAACASEPRSVAGEAVQNKGMLDEEKEVDTYSCVINVKCGNEKWKDEEEEMICRICHLSSDQVEFHSELIKLGCGCKGEIGVAHVHCSEAWFKLKGNRTCEVCVEAATNTIGIADNHFTEEWNETSMVESTPEATRAAGCWRGAALLQLFDGLSSYSLCPSMVFPSQKVLKTAHSIQITTHPFDGILRLEFRV